MTFRERSVENTEDCNAPAQPPRFPGLGIQGSAVAAAVTLPGVSTGAQGPQQVCPLFEGGEAAQASRRNHAVREIKRTMRRPRRQVATSETERRPMLISQPPPWQTGVYQHTNSITSDEHEVAIHSEELTRDPARA